MQAIPALHLLYIQMVNHREVPRMVSMIGCVGSKAVWSGRQTA